MLCPHSPFQAPAGIIADQNWGIIGGSQHAKLDAGVIFDQDDVEANGTMTNEDSGWPYVGSGRYFEMSLLVVG